MLQFTDIEKIIAHIEKDIETNSHCPVRFINVETMAIWVKVKSFLALRCNESIILSKYCEIEDSTPNLKQLKSYLRKVSKSVLLTPLSEHLRISNNIAMKTFNEILNLDFTNGDDKSLKVYIPVYRMKSLLKNLEVDDRKKDCIIFVDTDSDPDYSLTVIQDTLNAKVSGNEITGYKNYLIYWEQNPDKPIILHTGNAIHFSDIVFADDVKVIVTAFDLLRYHYKLPDFIKREWGDDSDWDNLLHQYTKSANLDDVLGKILQARSFSLSLFENWQTKSDRDKWYIWLWAKYQAKSPYLINVLGGCSAASDLDYVVYNAIMSLTSSANYTALYSERLRLIQAMKINPNIAFWDEIERLLDIDKLKCLTCNTEKEQEMIFATLQKLGLNNEVMELLKMVYPDLANYLSVTEFENCFITDYFRQYKEQKALNTVQDCFLKMVENIAAEQCAEIWKFGARNVLVNELYDDDTVVFFVDALGVEYVELLSELLKQKGLFIEFNFGHCNIPSTTNENKDFYKDKNNDKHYELDKLKHSGITYPFNLIKEFAEVRIVAKRIEELITDKAQIIVAADHGTSRLAVLAKGEDHKAKDSAKIYKYGRYCIDPVNSYSYLQGCFNRDNFWIFANYDRFSIQGAPSPETHGGASLEECIVPVLSVKKVAPKKKAKEKAIITFFTESVKIAPNKPVKIEFTLSKELANVTATIGNNRYICDFDGARYSFTPVIGKETEYKTRVVCKEIIGEFTFTVTKGISSNFDI